MSYAVAVLALVVAAQYAVIAVAIVPRLARLAVAGGVAVSAARWGATAFFAGCSLTHLGIAAQALLLPGHLSAGGHASGADGWLLVQHVLPHIGQVVGGALFIVIGWRRLTLTLMTKQEAVELRELELHLSSVFDRAPVGVALLALDPGAGRTGQALRVNPALCRLVGHDEAVLRAGFLRDLLTHPADRDRAEEALRALLSGEQAQVELELRILHRDGHEIWVNAEASVTHEVSGAPLHCVVQIRDITDDRRREAQLRHLAEHDSLTGLFNRRRFGEELDRVVATVRRYEEQAALLVIDLDQFKYVNDTHGHAAGDAMLVTVARVLSSRLRDTDVLGRLGGDEFGVLLPHTSEDGAATLAEALQQALRREAQIDVPDRTVRAAASIGISLIRAGDDADADQLLAQADIAMYEAKETGRDRVVAVEAGTHGTARMRARLTWTQRIRDALADDSFVLWEQPILNLATGICDRSELLLRMVDPLDGSLIPPSHFLYIAERYGQIQAIDRWVFARAILLLELRDLVGDTRSLEINLSGASLTDEALIDEIAVRLSLTSFDPSRLIVEVTETAAVGNVDVARKLARRLADAGCKFALDDFGSGFGSFFYLKHLPFDGVKIDGEFVKDLPESTTDLLTMDAIVKIAHGLHKEVTAEFVQNDETLTLLRGLGVGFAQGYHIAKPAPVPEFAPLPAI